MKYLLGCFSLFLLVGCINDKPVPETSNIQIVNLEKIDEEELAKPVSALTNTTNNKMLIQKHVIGGNVYVECIVPDFIFKKTGTEQMDGEGYLKLYVNGKVVDEISTAAFIIKGLEKGKHKIKLELMRENEKLYHLTEEFTVIIH